MAIDPETPDTPATAGGPVSSVHRWHPVHAVRHSPIIRLLRRRGLWLWLSVVLVALLGAGMGVVLGGTVHHNVGPVSATFRLRLGENGGSQVNVPPLGTIGLHDHRGPLSLRISIDRVDITRVRALISSTESTDDIGKRLAADVKSAIIALAIRSAVCAVAGAVIATVIVFRRPGAGAVGVAAALALVAASGGIAAATFRTTALSEPRFSGILASAPAAIGDVQDIEARFTAYREELAKLVTNVSKLYDVASTLPAGPSSGDTTSLLWVSDIHDNPEAFNVMSSLIAQFHVAAVVDSGDLSDHGTAAENALYTPIATLGVPYVYVKGNHDSEGHTVAALRAMKNVTVLDDSAATVAGITFAGIGDPRFTPNKTMTSSTGPQAALLTGYGQRLEQEVVASSADVAVIHDPAMSGPLLGHVPLVLAGHLHHRAVSSSDGTLLLTQGSTGGAGLRNLEGAEPLPLDASILYFDAGTHKLIAYDDVTVGGLGLTSVQIQRHAVTSEIKGGTNPVPPSTSPSAPATSATASSSAPPVPSASAVPSAAALPSPSTAGPALPSRSGGP